MGNKLKNVYFDDKNYMEYAMAYDRVGDYYFIKLVSRDMQDESKNRIVHSIPLPDITLAEAIELYFRMNNLSIKK